MIPKREKAQAFPPRACPRPAIGFFYDLAKPICQRHVVPIGIELDSTAESSALFYPDLSRCLSSRKRSTATSLSFIGIRLQLLFSARFWDVRSIFEPRLYLLS